MKRLHGNDQFRVYAELLDRVDYSLPLLLPVGLWVLHVLDWGEKAPRNKKMSWQLAELHGGQDLRIYLQLHYAFKIVYLLAGLIITAFLTLVTADMAVFFSGLLLSAGLLFLPDYEVKQKVKERRAALAAEFPEFLHKITLLLGAGMTIPRAWEKVVQETRADTPLRRELQRSVLEIQGGSSILQSYEDFARRCRLPQINKFITLILQNMKKGNAELVIILRVQASECWDARKHSARKLGEEASTKMLFPLVLMLIAVLLIVAAPAVLALQGF